MVTGAILTDSLPPTTQMNYLAGTATNGGVYNTSTNTLTWNLLTIPAGASVTETYQVKASLLSANSKLSTLVNNAKLVYPNGVTSASNTVTVMGAFVVHLAVYNSSGEEVKDLGSFEMGNNISDFTVVNGVITTDSGTAQFIYNNMTLGTWDATNPNGTKVTNGTYMVKIDSTDPFGVTTTVTHSVSVIIGRNTLEVAVYNEAGEAVKHFSEAELLNMVAGAGGSLLAADFDVGKAKLSSTVIAPSYSSSSGSDQAVTITLGSGRSFVWDGRGDNGNILTSGHYFLEIKSIMQNQPDQQMVMSIKVQNSGANAILGVVLAPNPINLTQTTQAKFIVNLTSGQVSGTEVKLYTVAGELIKSLYSVPGNPSLVKWDLSQSNLSSGTYLAVVEMQSANGGVIGRQILKVVVLR